jgi:hypothetical protein
MKLSVLARGFAVVCLAGAASAQTAQTPPKQKAPEGASVYFIAPRNGDTVGPTFTVRFGLKGMGVAPATVQFPNSGHHHLLVDVDKLPDLSVPLAVTDNIRHFGGGQTEAEIKLPPGQHTLQLVFADFMHIAHETPVMSEKITITVK